MTTFFLHGVVNAIALPTLLVNSRSDILCASTAAQAVYEQILPGHGPADHARLVFLDPGAVSSYQDWDEQAGELVVVLRSATGRDPAGRDPADRVLSDLVSQLTVRSDAFATKWAKTVRQRSFGLKRLRHRRVGDLDLTHETFDRPSEPRLSLLVYRAGPGSPPERAHTRLTALRSSGGAATGGGDG